MNTHNSVAQISCTTERDPFSLGQTTASKRAAAKATRANVVPGSFLAESCWAVRTLSLGTSAKEAVCLRLADHNAPRRPERGFESLP